MSLGCVIGPSAYQPPGPLELGKIRLRRSLVISPSIEQARVKFEELLRARNHLGVMSEDTHPSTGEARGHFPQTYSMVGVINGALRLSRPWEAV
jgi:GH15 family glucan-1,4-alpha-glucosidase